MPAVVEKELRRAVDTGKVLFGEKETKKSILKGSTQLIIISANAKSSERERVQGLCAAAGVPFLQMKATSLQIGGICGKPFPVSFLAVQRPGKSKILQAAEKKK